MLLWCCQVVFNESTQHVYMWFHSHVRQRWTFVFSFKQDVSSFPCSTFKDSTAPPAVELVGKSPPHTALRSKSKLIQYILPQHNISEQYLGQCTHHAGSNHGKKAPFHLRPCLGKINKGNRTSPTRSRGSERKSGVDEVQSTINWFKR